MDMVRHLGEGLEKVVNDVLLKAEQEAQKKINALMADTQARLEQLESSKAVLHVRFQDAEVRPLSKRASPVLKELLLNAKLNLLSLMVGPAGCGKTTAAYQVAEALGLQFGSICLTAGASETWLFGRQTPNGFVEGTFSKLYREGGVFLADEMDAADANLLLSINTALSHHQMFNPMSGETIPRHENFVFIGAANTNGKGATHLYTGRSRLDAATLDRFVTILVDYDEKLERDIIGVRKFANLLHKTRGKLRDEGYDEFISTRVFDMARKKKDAGVSVKDVFESLIINWSEPAKDAARGVFRDLYGADPGEFTPSKDPLGAYSSEVLAGDLKRGVTPYWLLSEPKKGKRK